MNPTEHRCLLRPEGELSIYSAAETKKQLLELLDQCTEAEIDLAQVSELDSAGLQLLVAAKRAFRQKGGDLKLSNHSPAVLDVFELCRMANYFGDPIVMTSETP